MRGLLLLTVASLALALTGCASSGDESRVARKAGDRPVYVVDVQYMGRVAHQAKLRGVEVQWVNPPYLAENRPPQD